MLCGGTRLRAMLLLTVMAVALGFVTAVVGGSVAGSAAAAPSLTTTQANLTSMVSATPSGCAPTVHASSDALAADKIDDEVQVGATMFAVGSFNSATPTDCSTHVTGTPAPRSNVMSFTAASGALTSFAPQINGEVWAVLPSLTQTAVYLCGSFTTADGVARRGLAKYSVATGRLDPNFDAHLDGACSDIIFVANRLVVMGSFKKVGTASRTAIAYIYQTTGAPDPGTGFFGATAVGANSTGATRIYRGFANPAGTALVVIGNFGTVGGTKRHQIAMLGIGSTSASLAPWYNTGFDYVCKISTTGVYDTWLRDIAWSPDGKFFVVAGTGSAHSNSFCDSIERFEYAPTTTNQTPTWHMYTDGDTIHSVVVTTGAVYYAGHMRYIDVTGPIFPGQAIPVGSPCDPHNPALGTSGSSSSGGKIFYYGYNCPTSTAVYRPGIGALNPATGAALSWNPMRTRNEGAKSLYVSSNPPGLWVGSDGSTAGCATPGGANHDDCTGQHATFVGGDAFFPLASTTAQSSLPTTASPTTTSPSTTSSAAATATTSGAPTATTSVGSAQTTASSTTTTSTTATSTTATAAATSTVTTAANATATATSAQTAAVSAQTTPAG
jgi:hypothetical protein